MSKVRVDYSIVQPGAKAADEGATEITNMMSALMQRLELLDSSWEGTAGTTFRGVKASIDSHTKNIASNLMEVANAIQSASGDFGNEDSSAADMLSKADHIADGLRA